MSQAKDEHVPYTPDEDDGEEVIEPLEELRTDRPYNPPQDNTALVKRAEAGATKRKIEGMLIKAEGKVMPAGYAAARLLSRLMFEASPDPNRIAAARAVIDYTVGRPRQAVDIQVSGSDIVFQMIHTLQQQNVAGEVNALSGYLPPSERGEGDAGSPAELSG